MARWLVEHTSWSHLLFLDGDVDLVSVVPLTETLRELVAHGHHVVIDVSAVEFLDLRGLEVFEQAHAEAIGLGRHLVLIRPSDRVQRVLGLLNGHLPVLPSVEAAATFCQEHI